MSQREIPVDLIRTRRSWRSLFTEFNDSRPAQMARVLLVRGWSKYTKLLGNSETR